MEAAGCSNRGGAWCLASCWCDSGSGGAGVTVGGFLFGWLFGVFFSLFFASFKEMGRAAVLDQRYTELQTAVFPLNLRGWFLEQNADAGSGDGSLA